MCLSTQQRLAAGALFDSDTFFLLGRLYYDYVVKIYIPTDRTIGIY